MMATTYSHPDGHGIVLGDDLMTACSSEGATVSPSIGPDALPALGAALICWRRPKTEPLLRVVPTQN